MYGVYSLCTNKAGMRKYDMKAAQDRSRYRGVYYWSTFRFYVVFESTTCEQTPLPTLPLLYSLLHIKTRVRSAKKKWIALNRSPSHRVERIVDSSRLGDTVPGRPQSAQSSFPARDAGARQSHHHRESQRRWVSTRSQTPRETAGLAAECSNRG